MNPLQANEARIVLDPTAQAELLLPLKAVFHRREMRQQCQRYIAGLMSKVERKNSWQLAESLGEKTPYRLQSLLGRSTWDAEQAVAKMQTLIAEQTSAEEKYLILDDTGFIKKGNKSVGVQSQYCGRSGKIDNCQTGVFLALASKGGTYLADRRLYMPRQWIDAKRRRKEANVPETLAYHGKAELAIEMLTEASSRGLEAAWVLGDSIYGRDKELRRFLEKRLQAYVLATSSNTYLWRGFSQWKLSRIARESSVRWVKKSCGDGQKGPREFLWAVHEYAREDDPPSWRRGVLFRRSLEDENDISYAHYFCPRSVSSDDLCAAVGQRWKIEECFQRAKGEVGLAEYEVRNWQGWHRHTALAMWALTILEFSRQQVKKRPPAKI